MDCVKNSRYSVFINGRPRGRIQASKGLRQGDPLSPFLFLLVSEVLSSLITNLHMKSLYEEFKIEKDNIHVHLLQFADDTLIFCKFDEDMLRNLRKTLENF